MKPIGKVLEPLGNINGMNLYRVDETNDPLITIPFDKSYIEILGHKVEVGEGGFKSFKEFVEWLEHIRDVEVENEKLKKKVDDYENKRAYLIDYLSDKLEEEKIVSEYEGMLRLTTIKERVYLEILNLIEEIDNEE